MAVTVPANIFQELVASVDKGVYKRKSPLKIDRKALPLTDYWMSRKKKVESNQGAIRVLLQQSADSSIQGWTNQDPLTFAENQIDLGMEFNFYNVHKGLLFVHDYLMNEGYEIDFNNVGPKIASPLSQNEANRLRNIVADKLEAFYDAFDVGMDLALHRDGTQDPKLPPGLDAFLPIANTTGSIGNISRSNPLVQHYVATGLTYAQGGTMRSGLNNAFWQARLNSRGRGGPNAGKYRLICGRAFADRFATYATNNSWQVRTEAAGTPKLDLAIYDSGLMFMGIPLEIDPTFAVLDALDAPATPWDLRCYGLFEDAFVLGCPGSQEKKMSMPPDPADVRVTRCSLDWRVAPFVTIPNACFVVTSAP